MSSTYIPGVTAPSPARSGILAGGNWIIDHHKIIDAWPQQDALANILHQSWGNGGSPYNILKDLRKLGAAYPLEAVGLVGEDADGDRILQDCRSHHVDTRQLHRTASHPTSYSDVMTVQSVGRRTFFHQRGANALLEPRHFDFSITATSARIFHLGYLLLLNALDELIDGAPRAVEVLRAARDAGLLTSVDCVSESSDRFQSVVCPALPEIDVLFINDLEAEKITGISLRPSGLPSRDAVEKAAADLAAMGVRRWVIIHFPEAAYAVSPAGESLWQPSLSLPQGFIKGAAGAGDAFAAGVLHGIHENRPMPECLLLGVSAAATSLTDPSCSAGVLTEAECLEMAGTYPLQPLPV
ncbi:MAG: carbohydrate kinase family protein [Candidatus Methylacidiphilales bacterium]